MAFFTLRCLSDSFHLFWFLFVFLELKLFHKKCKTRTYPTLQEAMRKAEAVGNDDCPVKIKLVAPPLYVLTTQTLDKVSAVLPFRWWIIVCYAWIFCNLVNSNFFPSPIIFSFCIVFTFLPFNFLHLQSKGSPPPFFFRDELGNERNIEREKKSDLIGLESVRVKAFLCKKQISGILMNNTSRHLTRISPKVCCEEQQKSHRPRLPTLNRISLCFKAS